MDVRDLSTYTAGPGRSGLEGTGRVRSGTSDADAQSPGGRASATDTSRLSAAAYAVGDVMQMPDVRTDRVTSLQARIADGSYQVSPSNVADAILRDVSR